MISSIAGAGGGEETKMVGAIAGSTRKKEVWLVWAGTMGV